MRGRIIKNCVCGAAALFLIFVSLFSSYAAVHQGSHEKKLVRVGFPIQSRLTEKDEAGNYSGYTVDYLNYLSRYTGWEIEYVEADGDPHTQFETLKEMLDTGEIDMLGAMPSDDLLEARYLYPTYNYVKAYVVLAVKADESRWMEDDFQSWNGIRVAVCEKGRAYEEILEKYAELSGFSYELLDYPSCTEALLAVQEGRADAVLEMDISLDRSLRSIAHFNPEQYYFAVSPHRHDILAQLNVGMSSLLQIYPYLQTELYNKYFTSKGYFYISDENKQWIQSLGTLHVLMFDGNAPLQYGYGGNGKGLAEYFFQRFQVESGLRYETVVAKNYEEGMRLIKNGKVDMIAAIPSNADMTADGQLRLSIPYFESNGVVVSNMHREPEQIQAFSVNAENMMRKMNHMPGMGAVLDAYCVNYYLQKKHLYDNITVDWSGRESILYSVGFADHVEERLISIINSFARSIDEDECRQMLYMSSNERPHYTLKEQLIAYKWRIVILSSAVLLIGLLYFLYCRNQYYKRSYMESERLYQFSKMTKECLFEYDYKRDQMILQNNDMLFPDQHVIQRFLRDITLHTCGQENERICADFLADMLNGHKDKANLKLMEDGIESWYRVNIVYIDGIYAVGRITEDNQEAKERRELERKAYIDPLTGLLNRYALEAMISAHLGEKKGGIYLLMDLDNFKSVNDTMGHQSGDRLLTQFAQAMRKEFQGKGLKARLGGDEFVVFLPEQVDEPALSRQIACFMQNVREAVFSRYQPCGVSVSIGAAYISENSNSTEMLYRQADEAMYVAKYGGKNDFFISDGTSLNVNGGDF